MPLIPLVILIRVLLFNHPPRIALLADRIFLHSFQSSASHSPSGRSIFSRACLCPRNCTRKPRRRWSEMKETHVHAEIRQCSHVHLPTTAVSARCIRGPSLVHCPTTVRRRDDLCAAAAPSSPLTPPPIHPSPPVFFQSWIVSLELLLSQPQVKHRCWRASWFRLLDRYNYLSYSYALVQISDTSTCLSRHEHVQLRDC
jgi:hypothetical protein